MQLFEKIILIAIVVILLLMTCSCRVTKYSITNVYAIGSTTKVDTHIKGSEPKDSLNGNDPSVSVVPL